MAAARHGAISATAASSNVAVHFMGPPLLPLSPITGRRAVFFVTASPAGRFQLKCVTSFEPWNIPIARMFDDAREHDHDDSHEGDSRDEQGERPARAHDERRGVF